MMNFATPEELAAHLAETIDDEAFITQAVRIKFPNWGNAPRFVGKTYVAPRAPKLRQAKQSSRHISRSDRWKPSDGPDQDHERLMRIGSKNLLTALQTGSGPSDILWSGATQIFENDDTRAAAAVERIHQREAEIDTLRVSRDACPFCATRADVGCRHRRVA